MRHVFRRGTEELQTWYRDAVLWPASPTCAVTAKVKGQGYKATSSVWPVFAHNSTTQCHRNTKIDRKVVRATADIPHHSQGQKVKRSKVKFKSPLVGGGGILWRPHYRPHILLVQQGCLKLFGHILLSLRTGPHTRTTGHPLVLPDRSTTHASPDFAQSSLIWNRSTFPLSIATSSRSFLVPHPVNVSFRLLHEPR